MIWNILGLNVFKIHVLQTIFQCLRLFTSVNAQSLFHSDRKKNSDLPLSLDVTRYFHTTNIY